MNPENHADIIDGEDAVRPDNDCQVELLKASSLEPQPIDWLWSGYLAAGKLQILGGQAGTGKTTIAMNLAATVSAGSRWPDGTLAKQGNVLIWSGEDDPADTLVPRLMASGANLDAVFFIGSVFDADGRRPFDPARDIDVVRAKLESIGGARLLIVDPVVSAVSADSHKNAEVRRGLQPLVDLAVASRCALLGITHFTKGTSGRDPLERVTGSLAFGAVPRIVLAAAKVDGEGDQEPGRVFCRAKSNIGPDDGGFEYELCQTDLNGIVASYVRWVNPLSGSARDLLGTTEDGRNESPALNEARDFLSDILANGPMAQKEVQRESRDAGIAWKTVRNAKDSLGVRSRKGGMSEGWLWQLPDPTNPKVPEGALQNPKMPTSKGMGTFANEGHLRSEIHNFATDRDEFDL